MEKGLVFGLNIGGLFGIYVPDSQSWRTSQRYLLEDWMPSLDRLPKSGIMRNGRIYEQATWVHRTKENGYGLLPTPQAFDGIRFCQITIEDSKYRIMNGHPYNWGHYLIMKSNIKIGYMNPLLSEIMMGYPIGWSDLKDSETQLSLK